nr:hypothetical protein [Tanacetum cinerariifolium]
MSESIGLTDSKDIQCAGFDHDHYQEAACANHKEHMMHDCVQLDHVVDSHDEYTNDSNIIMCDQYVRDNEVPVVHSGASSVPIDAFMMIYDDMCEPHEQSVSYPSQNTVVKNSLTAELAIYKEQVELYEQRAKFELTEREQKINEQLRIVISDLHNSEDTLEIAEITRKKMNDKMNDPECVTHKVKIAPHDYSKENLLATFTHQKQLTPEQIFWSNDLIQIKSEALKERTKVTHLQAQNDLFRVENDKIKQHYKELYDSIKITRAKHIKQVTKVTTENMNLKTSVSKATVNPLVSARDKHAIDVKPIVPRLRNDRNAHLDYLRHLKESVETICDIVEEAKVVKPLDRSIVSACRYTKHSLELLEYAIGTCPHGSQPHAKQLSHIPLIKKKQAIVAQPSNKLDSTTHPHVVTVTSQKTNVPVPPSIRVDCCPIASGSQPMSHAKLNRILPAKGDTKLQIDDQPRKNKSHLRTSTRIDSSSRLKRTVINSHSDSVCQTCAKCLTLFNHDLCVATCLQSAMATPSIHYNRSVERKVKQVWKPKQVRQVWKPTGKVLTTIGHQ